MWLIIRINNEEVSTNVLKVLIHIVHELHEVNKGSILDTYLQASNKDLIFMYIF
jgi:hypothetical protein